MDGPLPPPLLLLLLFFLSDSSSRLLLSPNPNLLLAALQSNTAPDQRIPADSDRAGAPPDVTVR